MTTRSTLLTISVLASLLAVTAQSHFGRSPADPCDATPEIHACAVFLQPEWQRRSVHAGRPAQAIVEPDVEVISNEEAVRVIEQHNDGV